MLLPDNINPENSIYYNASFLMKSLQEKSKQDFFELFQNSSELTDMSISTYVLCIDWLYLIDVVVIDEGGEISLCI